MFNFSAMTRDEAEALLTEKLGVGARLCAGGIQRDDGSFVSGECPTGIAANGIRFAAFAGLGAATLVAVLLLAVISFWQVRRTPENTGHIGDGPSHDDLVANSPTLTGLTRLAQGKSLRPPRAAYGEIRAGQY